MNNEAADERYRAAFHAASAIQDRRERREAYRRAIVQRYPELFARQREGRTILPEVVTLLCR